MFTLVDTLEEDLIVKVYRSINRT